MSKQVVMLFGQPGAGKGTQAEILSDKTGYYHFESSKIIEHHIKNDEPGTTYEIDGQTYKIEDERERWEAGLLNSPPLVVFWMVEKIKELAEDGKSIIFSGSPRTVYEAEKEIPLLKQLYGQENIRFVMLEITAETTIHRNSHRRICELIRHSILFSPETENLKTCPLDGSPLVKRKGLDDLETIKKRIDIYKEQTHPVTEVIEREGLHVHKVNGEQSVADVHKDVLAAIQ
jgi:adenylate kinase